jgi:hypothetical protein
MVTLSQEVENFQSLLLWEYIKALSGEQVTPFDYIIQWIFLKQWNDKGREVILCWHKCIKKMNYL